MKRFICIIILALLLCAPAMAEDAALTYCWFSFGGYLPSQTYEVTLEEGIYRLERDDGASCQLEEEAFNNLLSIIDNNDLYAWDGFNESEQYVLDGEGFSLDISFSDGRHIHAHGDNRFPEGYDAVKNEMVKLFDAILDGDFSGTYIYTAGGFGGDFTITLETDGSYTFMKGRSAAILAAGTGTPSAVISIWSKRTDLISSFILRERKTPSSTKGDTPIPFRTSRYRMAGGL